MLKKDKKALAFIQSPPPELLTSAFVEAARVHMRLHSTRGHNQQEREEGLERQIIALLASLEKLEKFFHRSDKRTPFWVY